MDYSDIFTLASDLEYIKLSESSLPVVKGKDWLLDTMNGILTLLKYCNIEDESVYKELIEWIVKLNRSYKKGQRINKKDSKELSEDANRWGDLIYKELCARPCIEFQRGALNQKALVDTSEGRASNIFEENVWKVLPKITKSDFADAAKCLLVGASTPATMVTLRGIEAVIKRYYTLKTKKAAGNENLGVIIEELKKMPKAKKKLLGYMDYIRSEKRNIAQHPTRVFTQREAERIFMEIVSATHDIYAEILSSKAEQQRKIKENS